MKQLVIALFIAVGLTYVASAADPEIAGNWIGAVDTDRGQMDIGLSVTATNGRLSGTLKTAHGDWEVTSIVEQDGRWIVSFKGGGNEGQMIGRLKDGRFAGDWKSKMANGTFDLTRARKKS